MISESDVLLEEAVGDELVVEEAFDQIVGLAVEKDDSFSVAPGILADAVDGVLPVLDQLDDEAGEFPQVGNRLEDHFQLVLPALPHFFVALLLLVLLLLVAFLVVF